MNKREIIKKMESDLSNARYLVDKELVSFDSKTSLEGVIGYLESILEYIRMEGKV